MAIDLDRLKVKIMKDHPFFGALLHTVTISESNQVPTAAMDLQNNMLINKKFWEFLVEDHQKALACHEIFHAVFLHLPRILKYHTGEDMKLGNIAADFLVNSLIKDSGMSLPPGALYESKYNPDKYTLESLMDELRKNPKYVQMAKEMASGGSGYGNMKGACQGNDLAKEGKQLTPAEVREQELAMKMAAASAVMIAKKQGKLPGALERFVDEMLKPKQNWREELREWFNVKIKDETSWNRPNRRFIWQGQYFPTKYSLGCGHIGVAIDVSGSIGQHELAVFEGELNNIFELCKPRKITVIYFDTRVHGPFVFDELPIKLEAVGGGGTDFKPPFDYFVKNKCGGEPITGLVFMTDMYGDWPSSEPQFPTVILSTSPKMEGPWGKTIYADLKNEEY